MAFLQNRKRRGQTLFDRFSFFQAGEILVFHEKGDALDGLSVLDKYYCIREIMRWPMSVSVHVINLLWLMIVQSQEFSFSLRNEKAGASLFSCLIPRRCAAVSPSPSPWWCRPTRPSPTPDSLYQQSGVPLRPAMCDGKMYWWWWCGPSWPCPPPDSPSR